MTPTPIPGQYNLRAVFCQVGNFPISDLGDGGIQFEMPSERIGHSVSGDGRTHFHAIHDDRLTVTISVMSSSQSAAALWSLFRTQDVAVRAGLPIPPILFSMFDPILGDTVNDPNAVFVSVPTPSKDVEEAKYDFQMLLPNGVAAMVLGAAQGVPQVGAAGAPNPNLGN